MQRNLIPLLIIGGLIRYLLANSSYSKAIENRIEISTPLNSINRVREGIHLYKNDINPYSGDIVHETPMILLALVWIFTNFPFLISEFYVCLDLITAILLFKMSREFVKQKLVQQETKRFAYAKGTEELQVQPDDLCSIPKLVLIIYLFNPFSVLNCAGKTSTVFSNLFLSLFLYFLTKKELLNCLVMLAIETIRNIYPVVLLAPVVLVFSKTSSLAAAKICSLFGMILGVICFINFYIMKSFSFLDGTVGFIFFYRDLQPNVGLFWYFFTEMFDHFRTMFLITFQMNATVLYVIPLSLKLRDEPHMLATVLVSLATIFRSYPCLGDIAFYLALLPLWRRCWKFMAHNIVVFGFFLVTTAILPALWHLWIYAGSANANFYFGATLAFSTGQIFLVTDILFAYVKREFCLQNGQKVFVDGKEAKLVLE